MIIGVDSNLDAARITLKYGYKAVMLRICDMRGRFDAEMVINCSAGLYTLK